MHKMPYLISHFPQKSRIISGSFAEIVLQLKACEQYCLVFAPCGERERERERQRKRERKRERESLCAGVMSHIFEYKRIFQNVHQSVCVWMCVCVCVCCERCVGGCVRACVREWLSGWVSWLYVQCESVLPLHTCNVRTIVNYNCKQP